MNLILFSNYSRGLDAHRQKQRQKAVKEAIVLSCLTTFLSCLPVIISPYLLDTFRLFNFRILEWIESFAVGIKIFFILVTEFLTAFVGFQHYYYFYFPLSWKGLKTHARRFTSESARRSEYKKVLGWIVAGSVELAVFSPVSALIYLICNALIFRWLYLHCNA